jgi:hypothetical protein
METVTWENAVRKMRRLGRIGKLAGVVVLSVGTVLAFGAPEASAQQPLTGQWCWDSTGDGNWVCLNAWNGGPWVNVSTNADTQNNDFTIIYNSAGYAELEDTGGNNYSGECIGDAYNESGEADTSLDPCGNTGVAQGWGTNFNLVTTGCLQGYVAFKNVHWGGYLGPPAGWVNGSHFYLNKPGEYCFAQLDPAE